MTTGLGITYHNDFEVQIYNMQKPTKDCVIQDFTYDYYTKYLQHKKLLSKKKVEKNLASLINSITNKIVDESKNFDPKAHLEKMKINM